MAPGQKTKSLISYLPERSYLNDWMRISDLLSFFHDFYSDFDLERAKQMLAGGVPPSEVCQYCGFGDYANFYRAFKAEYSQTPRQYIQTVRGGN